MVSQFGWFLGSNEQGASVLEVDFNSLFAGNVICFAFTTVADALSTVIQYGTIGLRLHFFYLVEREGACGQMQWKKFDTQAIVVDACG